MSFNRRPGDRNNRGRIQATIQPSGSPPPPPFAVINAPANADEGDDPAVTLTGAGPALSVTLQDISPVVPVSIQTGVVTPYATTYPNVTPGTRQVVFFNEALPAQVTAPVAIAVAPQAPIVSSPAPGASFAVGSVINFAADGTADGWDANTQKVEFYVDGVLRLTVNAPTAGVWSGTWDTTGQVAAAGLAVVARRYWVGLAGETGTIDQAAAISITLTGGGSVAPLFLGAAIDAPGTMLTLTFDQGLNPGSVPALADFGFTGALLSALTGAASVVGSAVELPLSPAVALDEVGLAFSYTAGANPIENLAGDNAANLVAQPVANGSAHAFVPSDVPGSVAWFDLQDPANFTQAGGFVTAVKNKISGVSWAEGVNPPAYDAVGLVGLPCMAFNGTTHRISSTEAAVVAAFSGASNPITLFIIGNVAIMDRASAFFGWGAANTVGGLAGQNTTGLGKWAFVTTNDLPTSITTTSTGDNNLADNVMEFFRSPAVVSLRVNGAAADPNGAANAPGATTVTRCTIGCRPRSVFDNFLQGDIGEIYLHPSNLAAAVRSRLRVYFGAKWGIAVTPG